MKFKILAMLMLSVLAFSACDFEPIEEVMEDDQNDTEVEDEMMEEEEEDEDEVEEVTMASNVSFTDFDQVAYDAAIAEGKDVFLDFHATWCPTCRLNAPNIDVAFESITAENLVGFRVNFDTSAELQKTLGVVGQSTLVMVPGGDEAANVHLGPGLVSTDDVLAFIQ
jgi:thiol:disulfide interchange protein